MRRFTCKGDHCTGVDKFKNYCGIIFIAVSSTLGWKQDEISHMHIHAVLIHMYTYPYIIYRRVRKTAD